HRGRISEGMDFADNLARVVVSIGIPFPSIVQDDVRLKMEFNDTTKPQVLNGREWYRIQAMRAVNQAVGRCIRHSKDWGAMLLVDQRFLQCDTWKDMCNWIK
ncbi:Fanconi anemia group J protein homolog, partial [Ixodes scapularis]